ncbi:MAG: hypothetical protein WD273_05265 [Trueperaceae bacterium]
MSNQGVRRFVWTWRRTGLLVGLLLAAGVAVWLIFLRPWPFAPSAESFEHRLESGVVTMVDYRERIEAGLRLHFLETALIDGRRSTELRPEFRVLEEQLESVKARRSPEARLAIEADLTALLPDLTRDRSAARERLVRLQEELRLSVGLGRQGDEL